METWKSQSRTAVLARRFIIFIGQNQNFCLILLAILIILLATLIIESDRMAEQIQKLL